MRSTQPSVERTAASATLTKAVMRAAHLLELSQQSMSQILGLSSATISRMVRGTYALTEGKGKEWELAVLFVRMYRSLDAIFGHPATSRQWLQSENLALPGKPADLIRSTEGLVRVLHYLDAHRGRV